MDKARSEIGKGKIEQHRLILYRRFSMWVADVILARAKVTNILKSLLNCDFDFFSRITSHYKITKHYIHYIHYIHYKNGDTFDTFGRREG
jgi:hypothetical protein